jgi:hypothetical protein
MSVAFNSNFGGETIQWRGGNPLGYPANTLVTGPVSNPTALSNPTVYLIFSGTSWENPDGTPSTTTLKRVSDVKTILASQYLSGLAQYGSSGTAVYGDYVIDKRTSPGSVSPGNGLNSEIQNALQYLAPASWQRPTGVAPNSNGYNPGATGYHDSPIYVVIDDNGDDGGGNGGGVYSSGGQSYLTNAINIDNGTNEDTFTGALSHELVERISDGTGAGIGMYAPVNLTGANQNAQIADNEPNQGNYTYRLAGSALVQAYWSVVDQKFIVPDGNQQRVTLTPYWNGLTSTNQFDLLAVQASPSNAAPTGSVINAQKTQLTLGNQTFNFDKNKIQTVNVYTHSVVDGYGQIWQVGGPGTTWSVITGANMNALQVVTDGYSIFMLASNNTEPWQVYLYTGFGTDWALAVAGDNKTVSQIAATGGTLYMLEPQSGGQVYQYNSGSWVPVTGTNTDVSQIAASSSGLYMMGNNGGADQVWQYTGSGDVWTPVTGGNTTVTEIASTGSELYMLANNGGADQVWQYLRNGTNWAPVTGATNVFQLVVAGNKLFMLANDGGANQVWQYAGSGTVWTPVTVDTVVDQIYAVGNTLFTSSGTLRYSGSGTTWNWGGGNFFP